MRIRLTLEQYDALREVLATMPEYPKFNPIIHPTCAIIHIDDDVADDVRDYVIDYQLMHCFTDDFNTITPFGRVLYQLIDAFYS